MAPYIGGAILLLLVLGLIYGLATRKKSPPDVVPPPQVPPPGTPRGGNPLP